MRSGHGSRSRTNLAPGRDADPSDRRCLPEICSRRWAKRRDRGTAVEHARKRVRVSLIGGEEGAWQCIQGCPGSGEMRERQQTNPEESCSIVERQPLAFWRSWPKRVSGPGEGAVGPWAHLKRGGFLPARPIAWRDGTAFLQPHSADSTLNANHHRPAHRENPAAAQNTTRRAITRPDRAAPMAAAPRVSTKRG